VKNSQPIASSKRILAGRLLTVVAAACIGIATLPPTSSPPPPFRPFCVACGDLGVTDVVLNVLLFFPLGVGLGLAGVRRRTAIVGVVGATVLIELLQLIVPGRDPNISDVLANSLGGMLGFFLATHWRAVVRPSPRLDRWLLGSWSIAWLGLTAISSYALVPSPSRSQYYGLIARDLGTTLPAFPGAVLNPRIDTITITDWKVPEAVRTLLVRPQGTVIRATLVPAACPTGRIAGILQIVDAGSRQIILLGQAGTDFIFGVRTGASVLRLRPVYYALPNVFGDTRCLARGDSIDIEAAYRSTRISIRASDLHRPTLTTSIPATIVDGWRLFTPIQTFVRASAWNEALGALWIFCLGLPFGYFGAGRGNRNALAAVAVVALLGFGLFVIPSIFGIARSNATGAMAATTAVMAGAIGRSRARPFVRSP
jgi:VanZ family protein